MRRDQKNWHSISVLQIKPWHTAETTEYVYVTKKIYMDDQISMYFAEKNPKVANILYNRNANKSFDTKK
jgi:hypothetical protein